MDAEQVRRAMQAKQAKVEAAQVLWNARLEILVAAGRYRDVLDHINTPVEDGANNCDCNRPCGASFVQDWLSDPANLERLRR